MQSTCHGTSPLAELELGAPTSTNRRSALRRIPHGIGISPHPDRLPRIRTGQLARPRAYSATVFELLLITSLIACAFWRTGTRVTIRVLIMVVAFILLAGQLSAAIAGSIGPAGSSESPQTPLPVLTLSAAVTQARTASPHRRAAAHVADSTREAARFAGRLPNPQVEFRTENWNASEHPSSPALDVFAVLTQPFELGGKRGIRRQLASAESEVALTALTSLERELALETVRAYVRALRARALVETLSGYREGLTTLVTSMARRVEEGYSAEADLLKFKTEAARVHGDIARAQLELERSLAALGIVIGAATPIHPSQLVEPPALAVPTADAGTIAAGIARHPDVAAATASVERARQIMAFERARRLPDAMVSGGYKRTAGFDTSVFGVTIALPLFDRNGASIARSAGVERGAMAEREALVHRLSTDAASVVRAARTIAARATTASQELLEPAEDVRRAARTAFHEGAADVLKLIDAERVYADVHRTAIDLRLDALVITIEARFALGEETIP
jgi:cobalt-zinc-cadmium efflux system outer membrane protein